MSGKVTDERKDANIDARSDIHALVIKHLSNQYREKIKNMNWSNLKHSQIYSYSNGGSNYVYGKFRKMYYRNELIPVVVKKLNKDQISTDNLASLQKNISILKEMSSQKNIAEIYALHYKIWSFEESEVSTRTIISI